MTINSIGVSRMKITIHGAAGEVTGSAYLVAVNARIHTLSGFSAHAGQTGLLKWFGTLVPSKPQVVLTHGEPRGRQPLADLIHQRHGLKPILPAQGDIIRL